MKVMNRIKAVSLVVIATMLAGCVPVQSLHPLVEANQQVLVPGLEGGWVSVEGQGKDRMEMRLGFEKSEEWTSHAKGPAYLMTFTMKQNEVPIKQKDWSLTFQARLMRIEGFLFLDLLPSGVEFKGQEIGYDSLFHMRAHTFWLVRLEGDTLRLVYMDDDNVKGMIGDGEDQVKIAHELRDGGIFLTASSADLRVLAAKYAAEHAAEAFEKEEGLEFHRERSR